MYAVVKDNIVVDCAIEDGETVMSPITKISYKDREDVQLVEMTEHNSPAEIGMEYTKDTFMYRSV